MLKFNEESELELRSGLIVDKDYSLINSKTWNYLSKWYGYDVECLYKEPDQSYSNSDSDGNENEESEDEAYSSYDNISSGQGMVSVS